MSLELRVLRADDRTGFVVALEEARARGDLRASSDPELAFTLPIFGVEPGFFGAAFDDDAIVGWISPELKVAVVRPDRRREGIGRRLVELGLSMEAGRGRPELFLGSVRDTPAGASFLDSTGFTFHSTVWDLELPTERMPREPVWPAGMRLRTFDRETDPDALPPIVNAAFADHPTPIVLEPAMLRASLDDPNILDDDALVLEDATGEIVGFCLADVHRRDGVVADHGEIGMVGVLPDRQGRGLGRQLLRAGIRYLRGAAVRRVGLSVNGRNDGALGLYESEGFERVRTRDRWAHPVAVGSS